MQLVSLAEMVPAVCSKEMDVPEFTIIALVISPPVDSTSSLHSSSAP